MNALVDIETPAPVAPPEPQRTSVRGQRVMRAACVIFAVHVVVDSYLDVRPGTSPGGHLVSGIVPVTVLAAVAALACRLSPGGFAATAWVLGLSVMIGAGGAPASGVLDGHLTLTTSTGLVSLAAALALIGAGAATLWANRRTDGARWRRYGRRVLGAVVAVVLAMVVAMPLGMAYFIANRTSAPGADPDLGRPHRDVSLHTSDGLTLAASYVPSMNRAAVIVFPGRTGFQTTSRARLLARHGYGVLVLDPRGQGDSDGDPNLLGWSGEADLRAAIDFLEAQPDVDRNRVGGLGLSVGGD